MNQVCHSWGVMSLVWARGRAVCQVKELGTYRPVFLQKWHMLVMRETMVFELGSCIARMSCFQIRDLLQ